MLEYTAPLKFRGGLFNFVFINSEKQQIQEKKYTQEEQWV